jgi:alpha-beta hydrolase superfamily lysophospholipase
MLVGVGLGGALLDGAVLEGVLDGVVVTSGALGVWHAATEVMTAAPISATANARADIRRSIPALSVAAASFHPQDSSAIVTDGHGSYLSAS